MYEFLISRGETIKSKLDVLAQEMAFFFLLNYLLEMKETKHKTCRPVNNGQQKTPVQLCLSKNPKYTFINCVLTCHLLISPRK